MASTAASRVDASTPVGNVSSALARKEIARPAPKKPGDKKQGDAEQERKPAVIRYPVYYGEPPMERYKDKFGIISMRHFPRVPLDQHLADLLNTMQRYFTETGVERVFMTYLEVLLGRSQIPYNPYPGFVRRLRPHAESRLIHMKPRDEILSLIVQPYVPTRIDYLYKNRDCDYLWGWPSVLSCCEKDSLKQYEWLVKDLAPKPITMRLRNSNFSIQAIVALIGAAVFHGTFVDLVPVIQVRVEYFIVGPSETEAAEIFINAMLADLEFTPKQTQHVVMGATVAVDPDAEPLCSKGKFWTIEEIVARENDFWREALATVLGKKCIVAEMTFKTDLQMGVFKRGQKFYTFNFRKHIKKMSEKEGGVSCYSELEEVSLHDGVFFDRGHAEAYITMFTPRLELIDKDKLDFAERPENRVDKNSLLRRYRVRRPPRRELQAAGDFPTEAEAEAAAGDRKVRVDGFQLRVPRRFAPDSNPVVDAIRTGWQRKVAQLHPVADIFEAMPYIVGLLLLDREIFDEEVLIQCYKIFRSNAARAWYLMKQNRFIRELIEHYEKAEDVKIVQHQFKSYKTGMKELLESELRECSSEMVTASRAIQHRLTEMSTTSAGEGKNVPLSPKSVLALKFVNHYFRPIFYQFVEDVQPECPDIFEIISSIQAEFPNEDTSDQKLVSYRDYFYGYEDERLMKQDRQVVDVQMNAERESAPSAIVIEAVLMKYLLNTHIDESWANFVMELLMKQHFPPNPFPRLISALRQSSIKMAYCLEEDATVAQTVYEGSPRLVDPLNFVFQMPGCDAFGLRSALVALDPAAFFKLSSNMQALANSKFEQRKGGYRAAVCMAVIGHVPYYGRLDPYLRVVELVDHIYVKGPSNCSNDGLSLYASIVRSHVMDLHKRADSGLIVVAVFLSGIERRWTIEDITARQRNFEVELENATTKRQAVYLKMFAALDWRYVTVIKHFRYHYVSYDDQEVVELFEPNPAESYLSVFFDKAKAAFYFQKGGSRQCQDPFDGSSVWLASRHANSAIAQLHGAQDWLGVHRWLLAKAFIRQSAAHVAEAWRMLHSKAAEINFLNAMNKTVQDLVYYVIERRQFRKDQNDSSLGALQEDVLSATFSGYYLKLNEAMSSQPAMVPRCMPSLLRRRLNSLVTRSPEGKLLLAYEPKTIEVLEGVRQSCLCVEQALAFDLHAGCRDAQQELRAIIAEMGSDRPEVFEYEEDRSMKDISRPQLVIADHVNEWHYDNQK